MDVVRSITTIQIDSSVQVEVTMNYAAVCC